MHASVASVLVWLAAVLVVLGVAVISPQATFFFLVLATLCAAASVLFAAGRTRAFAGIVAVLSLALSLASYPACERARDRWAERGRARSAPAPEAPRPAPEESR
jgi:membrane protein implicated in regulation of membrane protease activity